MAAVKIVYAFDAEQTIVPAKAATRGAGYFCPGCGEPVILKAGNVKVPHFAHQPDSTCHPETLTHITAKLLVRQLVGAWKAGLAAAPEIQRTCQLCGDEGLQALPAKVEDAWLEQRLPSGYVVDVGLAASGRIIAAVEIKVTHAVDERKAARLEVPFIEVDGPDILARPDRWRPLAHTLRPYVCPACQEDWRRFREVTARIAAATGAPLPERFYRYTPEECFRCGQAALVYTWPGKRGHTLAPPAAPAPPTVRLAWSRTTGRQYWANVCPGCAANLDDAFVYEPGGPFSGFVCGPDTAAAFEDDLRQLAFRYRDNPRCLGILE